MTTLSGLLVLPVTGLPELTEGDDVAVLVLDALARQGTPLTAGDVVVVSSKVVSKAAGLRTSRPREEVVDADTVRVVAERTGTEGPTRVVESAAGPVMAAAGVDASNVGTDGGVLRLPRDPDATARTLRQALAERSGVSSLAVVVSDTAGRPWRAGQTDFALGCAGLRPLEDHRGGVDHDGRPLSVTVRAVADEVAAAADLVKGKAAGVPVAVVRGLPEGHLGEGAAADLIRVGAADWFRTGPVEAVRAALGAAPGSAESEDVGIRSVLPEPLTDRVARTLRLALLDAGPAVSVDVEVDAEQAVLVVSGEDPYAVGHLTARLVVAGASEDLQATEAPAADGRSARVTLRPVEG